MSIYNIKKTLMLIPSVSKYKQNSFFRFIHLMMHVVMHH